MLDIQNQIDAGLERAFAKHGFAEPNIETLRKATGVSLRTLYKYVPSRDVMILRALEHRHRRYMAHVFPKTKMQIRIPLATIVDRVAQWMKTETTFLFFLVVGGSVVFYKYQVPLSEYWMSAFFGFVWLMTYLASRPYVRDYFKKRS